MGLRKVVQALLVTLLSGIAVWGNEIDIRITGSLPQISGAVMQHVTAVENHLYIAAASTRTNLLIIAEVSDAGVPELQGQVRLTGMPTHAAVSGNYAYVSSQEVGVHVVDVNNPADPVFLRTYNTPGLALRATVANGVLYVADNSGLILLNLNNPAQPTLLGRLDGLKNMSWDVAVSGTLAYVTAGSGYLQVIDVSNPTSPKLIKELNLGGNPDDIEIRGEIAYVAGVNQFVRSYSLANPEAPELIGSALVGAGVSLGLTETLGFVTTRSSGLALFDFRDPARLAVVGRLTSGTSSLAQTGLARTSNGFVCFTTSGEGLTVVQVTPSGFPVLGNVSKRNLNGGTIFGNTVVVHDTFNLYSSDVTNPANPQLVSTNASFGSAQQVAIVGNRLVVWNGSQVTVYAVRPDSSLELLKQGPAPINKTIGTLAAEGEMLYVPALLASGGIFAFQLDDNHELIQKGFYETNVQNVSVQGGLVAASSTAVNYPVYLVNFTNPENPELLHVFPAELAVNPLLSENRLYLRQPATGKVQIYDVSNPSNPALVGEVRTRDRHGIFAVKGKILYAAGGQSGFELWDVNNPGAPVRLGGSSSVSATRIVPGENGFFYTFGPDGVFIFASNRPAQFTRVERGPAGKLQLRIEVSPGQEVTLEQSSTLEDWQPLRSWTPVQPEEIIQVETSTEVRFYRLKQ